MLLIAFVAANLPFLSQRILLVGPKPAHKAFGWRLLELAILGAATIGIGFALEVHIGQRQPQGWEFYAAFACLFLTLAFPGFIWRMLRRHRHG
ncbi:MAG TPA: DUF2818 family protein [Burkholderiaceae bacterium]|nr:DUF2818 family protein [Burkholderiaceae bacterium]